MRRGVEDEGFPVSTACRALHVSRAGYYQWRSGEAGIRVTENQRIAGLVGEIHRESPDKGYRRIRDDLDKYYHAPVNDKRALRICRSLGIQSAVKYAPRGCTRSAASPKHLAENILNRRFYADRPNEKWLTDANDTALVHNTLDQALETNPGVHPMLHSDRGCAYTTQIFHDKLTAAGITQSMSRVGKCTDNGPMEGFWGILKRERYYGRRFTSRAALVCMIREYITYYNFRRLQRGLGVRTPMEVHDCLLAA